MNKKIILPILVGLLLIISFIAFADIPEEQIAPNWAENEHYKILCDKEQYSCFGGACPAYCNITVKKNLNKKYANITSWVQFGDDTEVVEFTLLKHWEYKNSEYVEVNLSDPVNNYTKEKYKDGLLDKAKSKFTAKKDDILEFEIMFNVSSPTVYDEFWVQIVDEDLDNCTLDPAITGCSENSTHVYCHSGSFSGNTITTDKNISIQSATINGQGATCNNGDVTLTSNNGEIYISSSTLNGYGGNADPPPDTTCAAGTGQVRLYAHSEWGNIAILSSTLNGYGGEGRHHSSYANAQTWTNGQAGLIRIEGLNIEIFNSNIYGYGGEGELDNTDAGDGGDGYCYIISNETTLIHSTASRSIDCYGGLGGDETT